MTLDVQALERATFAAVPPQQLVSLGGWLAGLDDGTVGRAHSAVPLDHAAPDVASIDAVAQRYVDAGLRPVWRLPQAQAMRAVETVLSARGQAPVQPTHVQVGTTEGLLGLRATHPVQWSDTPGEDWREVFLGPGFDARDGASRLAILGRSRVNAYASVRLDGRLVAVGSASLSDGWCGIHGMRTLPDARGQGCASAILAAIGALARGRGAERCFLQVDAGNEGAQRLYAQAGFRTAWTYAYWR